MHHDFLYEAKGLGDDLRKDIERCSIGAIEINGCCINLARQSGFERPALLSFFLQTEILEVGI